MKGMKHRILLISAILVTTACNSMTGGEDSGRKGIIPPGAVPVIYSDYVLVQGEVENVPASLLLDTGADELLLDSLFKSSNRIEYENFYHANITGIGTGSQRIIVITDSVQFTLSGKDYRAKPVPVLNIKPAGGDIIDGLLGKGFFRKEVLEVNYEDRYIAIHESIDSAGIGGCASLPVHRIGHYICVQVEIAIRGGELVSGDFILDTGSPTSSISGKAAADMHLDSLIREKVRYYTEYGGIGGESSSWDFIADSLRLGDCRLRNVNMSFSLDESGILAGGEYLGIIGNDVLDRFDLYFDFKGDRLYFRPNGTFTEAYEFDRMGFTWVDRCQTMGGWIVTGLTESSAAEKAGLMINDRILTVNRKPVGEIPFEDQGDYFKNTRSLVVSVDREGETLTFRFRLAPILRPG
ncbi:MAG: aspartyl protease family protein [Bacteroidota bacterium]